MHFALGNILCPFGTSVLRTRRTVPFANIWFYLRRVLQLDYISPFRFQCILGVRVGLTDRGDNSSEHILSVFVVIAARKPSPC
jgi:hypothetical protein